MAAAPCLLYWWLFIEGNPWTGFIVLPEGFLYLTAGCCMFQAHRQIMFVNYLPFLILALIYTWTGLSEFIPGLRQNRVPFIPDLLWLFMISVLVLFSALLPYLLFLYLLYRQNRLHTWKIWLISVITGLCLYGTITFFYLALVILEDKKTWPTSLWRIFTDEILRQILCFTAPTAVDSPFWSLYCVMLSLGCSKTKLTAGFLSCVSVGFAAIYLRPKLLFPFFHVSAAWPIALDILQRQKKLKHHSAGSLLCRHATAAGSDIFFIIHNDWSPADILVLLFAFTVEIRNCFEKFHFREKQLFKTGYPLPFTGLSHNT